MIDIHSHTKCSDGSSSVEELLGEAQKIGLSLLSITDHNTIQAHFELENPNIRDKFKGKIISGIEITTTYKGEIIEVLGYGFDLKTMQQFLNDNVLTFEEKQLKEYELIKNRYKDIGVIFDENNIQFNPKIESSRSAFAIEIKKYPKNYKFFLNQELINTDSGFTRNEVYNPRSLLYVDESSLFPSLDFAIEMIHNSGGLAFLAHPFAYSSNIAKELFNIIENYKLDGLECFYTTFTRKQSDYLVNVCKDRGMYMSGGSDFHGTRKINHNLGTGQGNLHIDESVVDNWISDYITSFDSPKNIK
ncbi:MAG: PHP domain-containing protein [Bacilli bacterium]|nr:PHP domain-containing protein [Bacilli bacterium]